MSKFKKWWQEHMSLKKAIDRSLKGTDFEGMSFGQLFSSFFGNLSNKLLDTGMTEGQKQRSDTELQNTRLLQEEEYDRKIDFYERFESPAAQVRQYKEAGLNPMLLAGSGASVSASGGVGSPGSVSQASPAGESLISLFGSLLGAMTKLKQISIEKNLTSDQNDIKRYMAETDRLQAQNYSAYLQSLTKGQDLKNDVFLQAFNTDMRNRESDTKAKEAQATYLRQVADSEVVRRRLMESGIKLNDSQVAINEVQKAILKAQEKYSDKYFSAVAQIADSQAVVEGINASVESKLAQEGKEYQYHARVAECADMIFKAGMDLDIWEGDAFKNAVEGTMTKKDWTQTVMGLLKTLIGTGAVLGAAGLRAGARAVVPPSPWTAGQQYQFYNATGYRFDSTL